MSAQIPATIDREWLRGVSDDRRISIIHRFILIQLCLQRQEDGPPGYDKLAAELGVPRASVLRAIDAAVKRGWLIHSRSHDWLDPSGPCRLPGKAVRSW